MEMRSVNMHFSLKKVILFFVLLNCVVIGVSSVLIIIFSFLFHYNNIGILGFLDLGILILLPITGMIAGFKIGNIYIFIYNTFAGLLNIQKIELNNGI
jgi:NADH:ubiquinone oxidoreductase subunit 3 (subunit A)